jgi:hypothetical protein
MVPTPCVPVRIQAESNPPKASLAFLGLVGRIRHNLHLGAQLDQFVGQTILGIAQNQIMVAACHLARQRRHHMRLGVSENDHPSVVRSLVCHFSTPFNEFKVANAF